MASVSSLDQDMRNLRMSRYTPTAAKEMRQWIESTLSEPLPPGDLLEALKDGVALCKLANLALPPPGIKFKASPMPFIQMENISHFLKACEVAPLNMPAHDRFLTVDLYESKDPAQVLQCLGAFSRQAHAVEPNIFKTTIGPKKSGAMSPNSTGAGGYATNGTPSWKQPPSYGRSPSPVKMSSAMPSSGVRAMSPSLTGGSTGSQQSAGGTKSPPATGPVSSWSNRSDEGITSPAWNIHQYGYMGGASQGNQGISFGARRQITSQAPQVPSLAEKERIRKQKAEEEARLQREREEEQQRRREELEAEERRAKLAEDARWEAETKRMREEERRRMEDQKRQWAEQERRWKEEEEVRRREDAELAAATQKSKNPPERPRVPSSGILRGQTLSQYQKEQAAASKGANGASDDETPEQKRVRELENQLAEAKERERLYQAEREERARRESERGSGSRPSAAQTQTQPSSTEVSEVSWTGDEREFLRSQWQQNQSLESTPAKPSTAVQSGSQQRPLPSQPPSLPTRTLPDISQPDDVEEEPPALPQRAQPSASASSIPSLGAGSAPSLSPLSSSNRALPTPNKEYDAYPPTQPQPNRTDRFLSSNTAPSQPAPRVSSSREAGDTSLEQASLRDSRIASQQTTKAGGWASKSLLEREMERERERQREWEANQAEIKDKPRDATEGVGAGQTWDVNQYGFTGGDSMNRGSSTGSGINFGGRRQIMGPREMKKG